MSLLTPSQMRAERLRTLVATFARANTTLIGHPIVCETTDSPYMNAPGWSTGNTITFNLNRIGDIETTDDIVKVTGLNWHELAHHWYTPMNNEWLIRTVRTMNMFQAFNMLEDQRIESMMTAMYPAFKPYFVMAIMKYIANGEAGSLEGAHALTYGRKFLPDHIRASIRQHFKDQSLLPQIEKIIDEYRVLVLPKDEQRAYQLIREFHTLLKNLAPQDQPQDPHGHGDEPCSGGASGRTQKDQSEQEKAKDAVNNGDDEAGDDDQYDDDGSGNGEGDDTDDDSDGQGDGDAGDGDDGADDDADGSGSGKSDADSDDDGDDSQGGSGSGEGQTSSDTDADDDGSATGATSGGPRNDDQAPLTDDELRERMQNIADQAMKRPDVQADAKVKESAIKRTQGQAPTLDEMKHTEAVTDLTYIGISNKFRKELQRLVTDSDPGWHVGEPSGKVNVKRYFNGDDLDTVFDRWDEGKADVNSIEVAILVDYSFSMNGVMNEVCQSAWAIQRAVQGVGGDVTILGFSDYGFTWAAKDAKAQPNKYRAFRAAGGTDPRQAIDQARSIMHYSKHKHRVVLFLTDGIWEGDPDQWRNDMAAFRKAGVMTGTAFLMSESLKYMIDNMDSHTREQYLANTKHDEDFFSECNEPVGLVELARKMVKQAMKS